MTHPHTHSTRNRTHSITLHTSPPLPKSGRTHITKPSFNVVWEMSLCLVVKWLSLAHTVSCGGGSGEGERGHVAETWKPGHSLQQSPAKRARNQPLLSTRLPYAESTLSPTQHTMQQLYRQPSLLKKHWGWTCSEGAWERRHPWSEQCGRLLVY